MLNQSSCHIGHFTQTEGATSKIIQRAPYSIRPSGPEDGRPSRKYEKGMPSNSTSHELQAVFEAWEMWDLRYDPDNFQKDHL